MLAKPSHSVVESKLLDLFPGSSTVEHSAVNRRVASSNLARGAKFLALFLTTCVSGLCAKDGVMLPVFVDLNAGQN
jgi:hypothetical protein